jgi:hypothetical protein
VKGEGEAECAMMQLMMMKREKSEVSSKKTIKRESLLKPNFRKPSSTLSAGNGQKKLPVKPATNAIRRGGRVKKAVAKPIQPNTQAITHSRLNLLRALSKVKTEQVDNKEEVDKFYTEKCRATLAEVGESEVNVKFLRSDEEYSDKSSSYDGIDIDVDPLKLPNGRKRKSPSGIHSEESSDGDYMKRYPNLHIEPPPKTEYNQEEFLTIFRLITPQVAESLKLRRSERKRRNCTKNHKTDFHYGNFDLNEVSVTYSLIVYATTIISFHFKGRVQSSSQQQKIHLVFAQQQAAHGEIIQTDSLSTSSRPSCHQSC